MPQPRRLPECAMLGYFLLILLAMCAVLALGRWLSYWVCSAWGGVVCSPQAFHEDASMGTTLCIDARLPNSNDLDTALRILLIESVCCHGVCYAEAAGQLHRRAR